MSYETMRNLEWGGIGDALKLKEQQDAQKRAGMQVPNYQEQYDQYSSMAGQYGGRGAPQSNAFTASNSSPFRGDQRQLAGMLMNQARGHGPGQRLVRMQAQQAADRGMAQQMAMANSGRPGMGAMGARNAMMNSGNIQSQVGGQAAMAGLQAQLGAASQLGGVLQGARGQDQAMGMFNAGQRQQSSQFNTDAKLRQMGLNDQAQLEALRQRLQLGGMQQSGGISYEQLMAQLKMAKDAKPTLGDRLMSGASSYLTASAMAPGAQAAPPPSTPSVNYGGGGATYNPY